VYGVDEVTGNPEAYLKPPAPPPPPPAGNPIEPQPPPATTKYSTVPVKFGVKVPESVNKLTVLDPSVVWVPPVAVFDGFGFIPVDKPTGYL
jgi:hypothetical protein